jgi:hypothetical protein
VEPPALLAYQTAERPVVSAAATAEPPVLSAVPTSALSVLPPAPTAEPPAVAATPAPPAVAPTPAAAEAWAATSLDLDRVWTAAPVEAVRLLEGFLEQYPGYPAAREKLYAALIGYGNNLADSGESAAAVQRLEQARGLFPDRPEAAAALVAMTPAPALVRASQPPPPASSVQGSVSLPRSAPAPRVTPAPAVQRRQAAPAPVQRVAPAAPVVQQRTAAPTPTPTKAPFVPR